MKIFLPSLLSILMLFFMFQGFLHILCKSNIFTDGFFAARNLESVSHIGLRIPSLPVFNLYFRFTSLPWVWRKSC